MLAPGMDLFKEEVSLTTTSSVLFPITKAVVSSA